MRIFGKGKCEFIANFIATMVTSLPSVSLCISLSLSLSHRKYLTHNIGNASAFPIIDSNTELGEHQPEEGPNFRLKRCCYPIHVYVVKRRKLSEVFIASEKVCHYGKSIADNLRYIRLTIQNNNFFLGGGGGGQVKVQAL